MGTEWITGLLPVPATPAGRPTIPGPAMAMAPEPATLTFRLLRQYAPPGSREMPRGAGTDEVPEPESGTPSCSEPGRSMVPGAKKQKSQPTVKQLIGIYYWYPEPGSNRHDIAVIGV